MTKVAFNRDGILDEHERAASARKCIGLLGDVDPDKFRSKEWTFFCDSLKASGQTDYAPTERQLAWLRDLVSKYVT